LVFFLGDVLGFGVGGDEGFIVVFDRDQRAEVFFGDVAKLLRALGP